MLERLTQFVQRLANWKTIVIVILLMLPFNLWLFPARSARLQALSGQAQSTLDSRLSYTPEQAYDLIESLGDAGRQLYALTEVTLDLVYPILYNLGFAVLIASIYSRAFPRESRIQRLALLPLAMLVADLSENICIAIMMLAYPTQLSALARLASVFTTVKWLLGVAIVALIVVGLVVWIVRAIRSRRDS